MQRSLVFLVFFFFTLFLSLIFFSLNLKLTKLFKTSLAALILVFLLFRRLALNVRQGILVHRAFLSNLQKLN